MHLTSDVLMKYCEELTEAVSSAQKHVPETWTLPQKGEHTIVPGQWVMVKNHTAGPLEAKWKGPRPFSD